MNNNFESVGYLVVLGTSFGMGNDPEEAFDQMVDNFGVATEDFDKCQWFTVDPVKVARYSVVTWEARNLRGELIEEWTE